ncbi:alpha/beta fold hydrolase [[Mycoplasma] collis]|uniref:alpha/beta fold hydrolase n=1 Tax=[Mycoplasma] collis TaxID=2127 RepID=UPI00051BB303|nr:alpha/beta hydrolase [[Mycoplasma] collis]
MKKILYDYPFVFIDNKKANKEPIIFVHGFNSGPEIHNIFANKWTDNDYYAIAFPGNSLLEPKNNHEVSVYQFADLLIEFIKKNELKNVIAIGHSMGGGIISLAYSKEPKLFSKLIYVAPMNKSSLKLKNSFRQHYFPKTFEEFKTFIKGLYFDGDAIINSEKFNTIEKKKFNPYLYNNPNILKLGRSLPNIDLMNKIEEGLNKINIPTLLMLGEKDVVIDREECIKYFKENVKNIQIEVFPQTGHMLYFENFILYFKTIKDFINLSN